MKKKLILLLSLMIVTIMAFSGCGGGGSEGETGDSGDSGDSGTATVIKIGPYTAEYLGYTLEKDISDNDILAVRYNFTNDSDESTSFSWAFLHTYFQDGAELDYGVVFPNEDTSETLDNTGTDIQVGKTLEVIATYVLTDLEKPVDVEFKGVLESGSGAFTIDLVNEEPLSE